MAEDTQGAKTEGAAKDGAASGNGAGQATLKWDDSDMSTSYANVVNLSMTREEVGLYFGTNLTSGMAPTTELTIKLSDRIIMTPLAAKRLSVLLAANLKAYEDRYGALDIETK